MRKPPDLAAIKAALKQLDDIARDHPELVSSAPPFPEDIRGWEETLREMEDDMATKQVAFRLPLELVDRLDAFAERMKNESPGLRVTRADAARLLLTRALDAQDRAGPRKERK